MTSPVERPLTPEQRTKLAAPLPWDVIRKLPGKPADYVSGHYVIKRLNEVFGPDGWADAYEAPVVREGDRPTIFVRGTLTAFGVTRGDVGVGVAADGRPDAFETAMKGAYTDCLKRCARKLGDSFGLALYEKVEGGQHRSGVGISTKALAMLDEIAELPTIEAINAWARINAPAVILLERDEQDIVKGDVATRRRSLQPAQGGAPTPAPTPAAPATPEQAAATLAAFHARVGEIELPGESVAVWLKYREQLAQLPVADREAAWKALCTCTESAGRMKNADVWLTKAVAEEDSRAQQAAAAPRTSQQPASPLDAYRARLAAVTTVDELVAAVLALGPTVATSKEVAWTAAQSRAAELGEQDLRARVGAMKALSAEPSTWAVVSTVLADLARADSDAAVGEAVKRHGQAASKLPANVRGVLSKCSQQRRESLRAAATTPAARFEAELRAARDIPALEAIAARMEHAATGGELTADECRRLSDLFNNSVAALESQAA